jgi:protein SCO1/2
MMSRRSMFLFAIVLALASGATIDGATAAASRIRAAALAGAERTFSLIDQYGRPVNDPDLRGHWLVVYFGFTQCADICPATLSVLASALRMLGADARELKPVFITIDPEHDTPQVLTSYLQNFGPGFIGLTGSAAQIAAAAQSFGAYSARSANGDNAATSLTHSSILYVIDPRGRLNRQLSSRMTATQLSTYLRKALRSEPIT